MPDATVVQPNKNIRYEKGYGTQNEIAKCVPKITQHNRYYTSVKQKLQQWPLH